MVHLEQLPVFGPLATPQTPLNFPFLVDEPLAVSIDTEEPISPPCVKPYEDLGSSIRLIWHGY